MQFQISKQHHSNSYEEHIAKISAKSWYVQRLILWRCNQFYTEQPKAHDTHCHAYSLSLSVRGVSKNTKTLRDTVGTAEEITILTKYSPKWENILGSIKEEIEFEKDSDFYATNLLKLSETRWTGRSVCFKRILDNYKVLWNVWKRCFQNDQMKTELKLRIMGVKTQMESFHLFLVSILVTELFSHTNNLSKTLQAKQCQHAAVKG